MSAASGLFGYYKQYLGYKNLKAKEHAEQSGLEHSLNEANNNLQITSQQAPLIPKQAAEDYAARGVAQSTFGAGMGDQWGGPGNMSGNPRELLPNGAAAPPGGAAPGTADYYRGTHEDPNWRPTSGTVSGTGQPVGTGLQRARDLSSAMISNAASGQRAAQDALSQYRKTINNNRHMFYTDVADAWLGIVMGAAGMGA